MSSDAWRDNYEWKNSVTEHKNFVLSRMLKRLSVRTETIFFGGGQTMEKLGGVAFAFVRGLFCDSVFQCPRLYV